MSGNWTLETITPEYAARLLANPGDNINRSTPAQEALWTENFAGIIRRGEWQITPQGICLGFDNQLFDGRHRLGGVVKSGQSIQVWVYRDPTIKSVHDLPIDRQKRRSDAFITGLNPRTIGLAGSALSFHVSSGREIMSPTQVGALATAFQPAWDAFGFENISANSRKGTIVGTTAFQLACLVHYKNGTASLEYLQSIISALKDERPADLPPFVLAFYLSYQKENRHPAHYTCPRIFRALTERLGPGIRFIRSKEDRSEFVTTLRKTYKDALPIVAIPMIPPRRNRLLWTDEEVSILARASRERWSIKKTGTTLRRTHNAIRSKASDLGMALGGM
jgi:hypothetical protein